MFAPGLSHRILGMVDTRLKSGVTIFSQRAEQISPGHPPRPRPLHADPTGPGKDKVDTFMVVLAIIHHPAASWEVCSAEPGLPTQQRDPGFLGLLPASTGIPGTQHTHPWGPSSRRGSPRTPHPHPASNSCGSCLGRCYCRCFQCKEK